MARQFLGTVKELKVGERKYRSSIIRVYVLIHVYVSSGDPLYCIEERTVSSAKNSTLNKIDKKWSWQWDGVECAVKHFKNKHKKQKQKKAK